MDLLKLLLVFLLLTNLIIVLVKFALIQGCNLFQIFTKIIFWIIVLVRVIANYLNSIEQFCYYCNEKVINTITNKKSIHIKIDEVDSKYLSTRSANYHSY